MQSAWCTFEPNFNVTKILKKCHFQSLDLMNQNFSNHEHAEYDPNIDSNLNNYPQFMNLITTNFFVNNNVILKISNIVSSVSINSYRIRSKSNKKSAMKQGNIEEKMHFTETSYLCYSVYIAQRSKVISG